MHLSDILYLINTLFCMIHKYNYFRLGPMTTSWCMRFEAKHRYFKTLAAGLGNFKNLPFTLAQRHQNKQCYAMYDMCKPTECGRGNTYFLVSFTLNNARLFYSHDFICLGERLVV